MKKEYTRDLNLSPQQNELLRKAFNNPELFPVVSDAPTTDTLDNGEFKIYDDGTDKWLYTKVDGSIVTQKLGMTGDVAYGNTRFCVLQVQIDTSTTGDQAISGVGFAPKAFVCMASYHGTNAEVNFCIFSSQGGLGLLYDISTSTWASASGGYIHFLANGGTYSRSTLKSWDADGITITKEKNGSPAGTAYINFLFFR